jgi:YHS domain-containing protein
MIKEPAATEPERAPLPDTPKEGSKSPNPTEGGATGRRGPDWSRLARSQESAHEQSDRPLRADWNSALHPESVANPMPLDRRAVQPVGYQSEASAKEPPLALDGYCAVELSDHERWVRGDGSCRAVHQGRTYLFTSLAQQEKFLASPKKYAPACSGDDPVLATDEHRQVAGSTQFSAIFDGRVYLFSDSTTLARFRAEPDRYAKTAVK